MRGGGCVPHPRRSDEIGWQDRTLEQSQRNTCDRQNDHPGSYERVRAMHEYAPCSLGQTDVTQVTIGNGPAGGELGDTQQQNSPMDGLAGPRIAGTWRLIAFQDVLS